MSFKWLTQIAHLLIQQTILLLVNVAGNSSTPVSGIILFHEWDHHYYRRTGAGTSESPHAYALVTEGASGCDASADGGTACSDG